MRQNRCYETEQSTPAGYQWYGAGVFFACHTELIKKGMYHMA
jgi:hypothetical protein